MHFSIEHVFALYTCSQTCSDRDIAVKCMYIQDTTDDWRAAAARYGAAWLESHACCMDDAPAGDTCHVGPHARYGCNGSFYVMVRSLSVSMRQASLFKSAV